MLGLFTAARNSLVDVGIGASAARRLQGLDLALQRRRDGVPNAAAVVLRAVLRDFLPRAGAAFTVNQQVRYVLSVEDDCRLVSGVRLSDILSAARRARSRLAWLGYGMRRGETKVGARLVCFCRVALAPSQKHQVHWRLQMEQMRREEMQDEGGVWGNEPVGRRLMTNECVGMGTGAHA